MRLYAISDLHVNYPVNRAAVEGLAARPDDGLILAGDLGDTLEQVEAVFAALAPRFARLWWVPGNHELWTPPREPGALRGVARYDSMVALARRHGVLTPEDEFALWEGEGGPCRIAPLFLLYDYSFRPDEVAEADALAWAAEAGIMCTDERYLHPDPYPSRGAWCRARLAQAELRLAAAAAGHPLVVVNHYPLRQELCRIPRIPRFSLWCGTRATEDWHTRFRARVVVSGHLHVRATDWRDGVRFEEVAVGYPRHWNQEKGLAAYLREVLPGPAPPPGGQGGPVWHR